MLNTLNTSFSIAAWTRRKRVAASNANQHITLMAEFVSRHIFRVSVNQALNILVQFDRTKNERRATSGGIWDRKPAE